MGIVCAALIASAIPALAYASAPDKSSIVQDATQIIEQVRTSPETYSGGSQIFPQGADYYLGDPINSYYVNQSNPDTLNLGGYLYPVYKNRTDLVAYIEYSSQTNKVSLSDVTDAMRSFWQSDSVAAEFTVYGSSGRDDDGEPLAGFSTWRYLMSTKGWIKADTGEVRSYDAQTPFEITRFKGKVELLPTTSDIVKLPVESYQWVSSNGAWHLLNSAGTLLTGWQNYYGTWCYFDHDGNLLSGWVESDGSWYYLSENHDGTFGALQTGWISDGLWYYADGSGALISGWLDWHGHWYLLNDQHDGTFGSMLTGWNKVGKSWYYLDSSGMMLENTYVEGYWLNDSGAWVG